MRGYDIVPIKLSEPHVHHCVNEKEGLHGRSHSCPCGFEWTKEEHLTLAPYLKVLAEAV